jgi:hypothetical protein
VAEYLARLGPAEEEAAAILRVKRHVGLDRHRHKGVGRGPDPEVAVPVAVFQVMSLPFERPPPDPERRSRVHSCPPPEPTFWLHDSPA